MSTFIPSQTYVYLLEPTKNKTYKIRVYQTLNANYEPVLSYVDPFHFSFWFKEINTSEDHLTKTKQEQRFNRNWHRFAELVKTEFKNQTPSFFTNFTDEALDVRTWLKDASLKGINHFNNSFELFAPQCWIEARKLHVKEVQSVVTMVEEWIKDFGLISGVDYLKINETYNERIVDVALKTAGYESFELCHLLYNDLTTQTKKLVHKSELIHYLYAYLRVKLAEVS